MRLNVPVPVTPGIKSAHYKRYLTPFLDRCGRGALEGGHMGNTRYVVGRIDGE